MRTYYTTLIASLHIESRILFEKNPALRRRVSKEKNSGGNIEPFFDLQVGDHLFLAL